MKTTVPLLLALLRLQQTTSLVFYCFDGDTRVHLNPQIAGKPKIIIIICVPGSMLVSMSYYSFLSST